MSRSRGDASVVESDMRNASGCAGRGRGAKTVGGTAARVSDDHTTARARESSLGSAALC
ncbi:MAG: hypothetical protein IPK00_11985 [Deltaproteobacteria bacterium]|nr:hypothetical protein [Deltaproteobacteria bacterium]